MLRVLCLRMHAHVRQERPRVGTYECVGVCVFTAPLLLNAYITRMRKAVRSSQRPFDYRQLLTLRSPPFLYYLFRSSVRDIDPTNDLTFLRIRSKKHEILVAPRELTLTALSATQLIYALVVWGCSFLLFAVPRIVLSCTVR
jgi:hypothetical protein